MHNLDVKFYRRTEDSVQLLVHQPGRLQPGQIMALAGIHQDKTYGRVTAIRHSRKQKLGLITVSLLTTDQPDPDQTQVHLVSTPELLALAHQQMGRVTCPISLNAAGGELITDARQFAPLSWLDNRDPQALRQFLPNLLNGFMPYSRVVVLDPTGLYADLPGFQTWQLGRDTAIGLNHMGWPAFTQALNRCLPTPLQEAALNYLLPEKITDFTPFSHLIKPVRSDHPLDEATQRVLQHSLVQLQQWRLFAETPEAAFHPTQVVQPVLLQFAHLPQPWRSAALMAVWRQWTYSTATTCVLIEPQRFMSDAGLICPQHTVLVASAEPFAGAVSQLIRQPGGWVLQGQATGGFPVPLHSYQDTQHSGRLIQVGSQYEQPIETDYSTDASPTLNTQVDESDRPFFIEPSEELPPPVAQEPEAEQSEVTVDVTDDTDFSLSHAEDAVDDKPVEAPFYFELDKVDRLTELETDWAQADFSLEPVDAPVAVHQLATSDDGDDLMLPGKIPADGEDFGFDEWGGEAATASSHLSVDMPDTPTPSPTFVPVDNAVPDISPEPYIAASPHGQFTEGDMVRHPKYGQGTVRKVIWMDADHEVINVQFERAGKRLLDPSIAALEKIG